MKSSPVFKIIWPALAGRTTLNFWQGPYKTRIGAHWHIRHISAYRDAWWLATLRHMAVDNSGDMAE